MNKLISLSAAPSVEPYTLPLGKDYILVPVSVNAVVYQNSESDFSIYKGVVNLSSTHFSSEDYPPEWRTKYNSISVKGRSVPGMTKENCHREMVFIGTVTEHPKYGRQLNTSGSFSDIPSKKSGMKMYLETLPNLGPERAKILTDRFSCDEIVDLIENRSEELASMKIGLTKKRVVTLRDKWVADRAMRGVYEWLGDKNISYSDAEKIVAKWGEDSVTVVKENPYVLTEIRGFGFEKADFIAHKLVSPVPIDTRTSAALSYLMGETILREGHLCLPMPEAEAKAMGLLINSNLEYIDEQVSSLYRSQIRTTISDPSSPFCIVTDSSGQEIVYSRNVWKKEQDIAVSFADISSRESLLECNEEDIKLAQEELSAAEGKKILLDDSQKEAVMSSFNHPLTIITGGGGSGKSTICRCICSISKKKGLLVQQMAPTGKAAKVLQSKTGHSAGTIHRSLGFIPGREEDATTIGADIAIIDEFSMCGIDTTYALSKSIPEEGLNVVIVGDPQQLPSVSPGSFLSDLIASGCANLVILDRIYRQRENSFITSVADDIAKGRRTIIPPEADDIRWSEASSFPSVSGYICSAFVKYIQDDGNLDELHAMAPMYKGDRGVSKINTSIQEAVANIRGETRHIIADHSKFFIGDRVMQWSNNYEKNVFNGDMGVVSECGKKVIDKEKTDVPELFVVVDYGSGRPNVRYKGSEVTQIRPAWCTTVHKYQGSQCKNIIFVMASEHRVMMSRELVYTAFTRAQDRLLIVGDSSMLSLAPSKSSIKIRHTTLSARIRGILGTGSELTCSWSPIEDVETL